jgi:hypothetical protein
VLPKLGLAVLAEEHLLQVELVEPLVLLLILDLLVVAHIQTLQLSATEAEEAARLPLARVR